MNASIILQLKLKKPSDSTGTIIIRAFLNRRPIIARSTGQRVHRDHWDAYNRKVKETSPNGALINVVIQKQLQDVQGGILQKQIMGATINQVIIKEAVKGYQSGMDFYAFCSRRILSDYKSPDTIRMLNGQISKLKKFRPALSFSDIDYHFLDAYKKYMVNNLGNKPNTVWSGLKFLCTMLNKAIAEGGIINYNPFDAFDRGTYKQVKKPSLTIAECTSIENLLQDPCVTDIVKAVAVRFLLMAYSGMRFADAMKFNPGIHVKGDRLVMDYNKWSEKVDFQLHDRLKRIIELIPQYPLKISLNYFNMNLKIIRGLCKIKTHVTSHIGRHTMGFFLSEKDIPKEKAQKILGHKSPRSTDIYYHVTDDQVDRAVQKLNEL